MNRSELWPDFRDAWIVYEDDALIAVDKPVGMPSQPPDPARTDDVVTRLKSHLAARGRLAASQVYLGVHHRLDRETSGVMLFTKEREANPGLAAQFEGRRVEKEYLAAVRGWPERWREKTLQGRLARGEGSAMRVLEAGERGGIEAITHVRVVDRRGDRALLAVRIETGRTHQVRAQLAAAGSPVAGDALYGGSSAPRLLLHAASLTLVHPASARPLRIVAPTPPEFGSWMAGKDAVALADPPSLRTAIDRAIERRFVLGRSDDTDAFRLLDGAGDGVPGLALDAYGPYLVAHFYGDEADAAREAILDVLEGFGFEGVYLKRHPRQANVVVDPRRDDLAPPRPVRGRAAPDEFVVRENGLAYRVALGDGLSTGIFLDQRDNRRRVRESVSGATVLNLFAYTCAFTVAAAAGGARRTLSVDASAPALARGERNVAMGGFEGDHRFVREDVFPFLEGLARSRQRFDWVIVDPPTYSTTASSRWTSGKDWRRLAAACLRVLSPKGRLLACSNDQRLSLARFRRHLHDASRDLGRPIRRLRDFPPPLDFPAPLGKEPHLKTLSIELA